MNLPSNLFDGNVNVQTFLCQPNKEIIGEILPYDFDTTFKFNTYSEISFTIDKYYNDLFEGVTKVHPYYDWVESLRVIYLRGIGHFVIQDVEENEADTYTKSIACFSLEYSTGQKYLENFYVNTGEEGSIETMYHTQQYGAEYSIDNYYTLVDKEHNVFDPYERYYIKEYSNDNGVSYNYVEKQILDENDYNKDDFELYIKKFPNVRFYWPTKPELSLLHHIFDRIPEWKIGHVDKELWYQERTFSEDRTAVYDFLYNKAADTLNFVMEWDSINGVCNFYKTEEDGITTDTYVRTNVYNPGFVYYSDANGTVASSQPENEDDVINGVFYINVGSNIETQWDTDVFISRENLASNLDIKYSTDDIKTKLKISGSDDLDVRDVNLGQNYILNLSYYNTPLWLGEDLHSKYNAYINDLAIYTEQYEELISAWSAAYNEYNDLMNYVPVDPRVLLVGDEFEKLYCTYSITKATEYVENGVYYDNTGTKIEDSVVKSNLNEDGKTFKDNVVYYINKTGDILPVLKEKLGLYRVGVDDNGKRSEIDKTDDVLLTLENARGDSATIRMRCIQAPTVSSGTTAYYKNSDYKIYCTKTTASSGLSITTEYYLVDWVSGTLTADKMKLLYTDDGERMPFKVKSIGTLGAYLCLARDETKKAEVEDYGIRLLQEKQDVYTKIFITQTEGYMSQEGSRCVAMANEPEGASVGDKWLNTGSKNAAVYVYVGDNQGSYGTKKAWKEYSTNEDDDGSFVNNSADFENYTRFLDNYKKLQVVQEVLAEKQKHADYLLNGIPLKALHLVGNNVNLYNLLRASALHFIVQDADIYTIQMGDKRPGSDGAVIKEGSVLFETVNNGYSLYTNIYQYKNGWNEVDIDIGTLSLTGYDEDYGIITFIVNPTYKRVVDTDEYSNNEIYFLLKDGQYIKPQMQPTSTTDLVQRYEYIPDNAINGGTKCYFTIGGVHYAFTAPEIIKEDETRIPVIQKYSTLMYNSSTNQLIVGAETITPEQIEDVTNMTELSFTKLIYYVIEGVEYATYVIDGTPYVSYARSQGVCLAKMNVLKDASDMNTYFNEHELVRLSPFIREDEFSDSNFLLTTYESEEEQMNIKQELLKAGEEELKKICQPKLSFNATMANILAIPEFAPIRNQFKLGNFVRVGIREGYTKRARLLEVQINFDDPSDFSCTFGDLISTRSEIDKHAELLQQAVTAGKSVASNASKWQKGADKATALDQAINDGLRNAALSVGAADGQSIVWDKYGIRGRKLKDGSTDEYEDQQFALINNKLVFTDDNWATSRAVVGEFEIELPNDNNVMVKQNMYGLLADAIVGGYIQGTDIVGGSLKIGDGSNNYFQVDEKGDVTIVQAGAEKYATANALEDIKKAYRYSVRLEYTGSTIITGNETTGTTIKAFVYDDGKLVEGLSSNIFNWKRSSGAGNDTEWNNNHKKYGNTLIVTHEDVNNNTHFWCEVDI